MSDLQNSCLEKENGPNFNFNFNQIQGYVGVYVLVFHSGISLKPSLPQIHCPTVQHLIIHYFPSCYRESPSNL